VTISLCARGDDLSLRACALCCAVLWQWEAPLP
jgi:hypothetical protein